MDEIKNEILMKYNETKVISYMQLVKLFKKFDVEINQFNFAKLYSFLENNNISLVSDNTKKMVLTK